MTNDLDNLLRQASLTLDSQVEAPRGLYERLRFVAELVQESGVRSQESEGADLLYRQGDGKVVRIPVTGELTVGREAPSDVVVKDSRLSRQHFRIRLEETGMVIEDLDSRNGTWVNGARIVSRELLDGDVIEVGGQVFVFVGPA